MHKKLLELICCPVCKENLKRKQSKLICTKCKQKYEIKRGIPVLINLKNLPDYVVHQIDYFENEDKTRSAYTLDEWQKSYLRRFCANTSSITTKTVFDIGCGSGYMAVELATEGAIVVANDITIRQLYKLQDVIKKHKLEDKLFLVCCSAESLPLKNNSADIVIENAILEHLPNEKEALEEVKRVCRRDSYVVISVPQAYRKLWPFLIPINIWYDKKIGHLRRYTKNNLVKKMKGFSLVNIYYSGHLIKFILFTLSLLFKTNKMNNLIERIDEKFEKQEYGATVLTAIFRRRQFLDWTREKMGEIEYVCLGSCHAVIDKDKYSRGLTTCGNNACNRKGQKFVRGKRCKKCKITYGNSLAHKCLR